MKRLIDNMFYRAGDEGGVSGTGIPAAPAYTEDTGVNDGGTTGIPASLPVTDAEEVHVDNDDAGTPKQFSVDDEDSGFSYDDIPFRTDERTEIEETKPEAVETKPEGEAAAVVVVEQQAAAEGALPESVQKTLKAVAESYGITETDPDKLLAAIEAKRAEDATGQQQRREQAEAAFEQKVVEGLQQKATQDLIAMLNPAVKGALLGEGFSVDEAPEGWWDNTSPNYDETMTLRYNQLYNQFRVQPQFQSAYENAYNGHKAAYDAEKAAIAEFSTKYPNHAAELISDLRQAGATAGFLERIAHVTDQAVTRAIATTNSANAAKDTELTTLRAQVSGHAAALEQARAEGKAEGQKAALVLAKGQSVPNTVGVNAVAPAPYKHDPNWRLTLDDIPFASRNRS